MSGGLGHIKEMQNRVNQNRSASGFHKIFTSSNKKSKIKYKDFKFEPLEGRATIKKKEKGVWIILLMIVVISILLTWLI